MHFQSQKENLGTAINSNYTETKPVISGDGQTLYFCRQDHPDNIRGKQDPQDIYFSRLVQGKWSTAQNIGWPLNDQHPNGISSVSPDGNSLLLINEYISGGYVKPGASVSHFDGKNWTFPKKLEIENFYNFSPYVDYFMSSDNKVLFLSVQRREGSGDQDLYVSFIKDNLWSEPVNLGPVINTPGADFAPFLAADGKTLYFASDGHNGLGGSDIFYSRRLDDSWKNWSTPVNLGDKVNTKTWDAYYSISAKGDYAYFVSTNESDHSKDIYRIRLPEQLRPDPVVMIKGKVLNANTNEPLSASVIFKPQQTPAEQGLARSDPGSGNYKIVLPRGDAYYYQAKVDGYLSLVKSIDLTKATKYGEVEEDLYLVPLAKGQKIPLNNIFFVRSQAELQSQSYQELNQLVAILKENSTLEIELGGHTDNLGQSSLNFDLSLRRVAEVKRYLVNQGIPEHRLHTKGYGDTQPIASNDRELHRRLNRRVEFTILNL
ncbi:MAG: membrane protein [Cyclobacteriaceae bacterium]|nr:MAG: membrane protein [Cyclobacteriaceae bacterium]